MLHGGSREHLTRFGTRRDLQGGRRWRGGGWREGVSTTYVHTLPGWLALELPCDVEVLQQMLCLLFNILNKSPDNGEDWLALSTDYHNRTSMIQSDIVDIASRMTSYGKERGLFQTDWRGWRSGDNVATVFSVLGWVNCCSNKWIVWGSKFTCIILYNINMYYTILIYHVLWYNCTVAT